MASAYLTSCRWSGVCHAYITKWDSLHFRMTQWLHVSHHFRVSSWTRLSVCSFPSQCHSQKQLLSSCFIPTRVPLSWVTTMAIGGSQPSSPPKIPSFPGLYQQGTIDDTENILGRQDLWSSSSPKRVALHRQIWWNCLSWRRSGSAVEWRTLDRHESPTHWRRWWRLVVALLRHNKTKSLYLYFAINRDFIIIIFYYYEDVLLMS